MNDLQVKGNWNQIKGKLKEKYGQLTDDDLEVAEGNFDQTLGRIQKKTGKSREEIEREINQF